MNLSELHPDELLWRESCGTLSPNERADLTAHLQRCPACALERVVRMEAARVRVPSEADHALAARLVDRVLAASDRRPVTALRGGWRRPLSVAAMLLLLVAGTAIAATALVVRVREQRASRVIKATPGAASARPVAQSSKDLDALPSEAAVSMPPAPSHRAVNRSHPRPLRARTLAFEAPVHRTAIGHAQEAIEPAPRPLPAPTPARTVALPHAGGEAPAAGNAPAAAADSPPSPAEAPSVTADPPAFEAPALLRRAEQARTAKRWTEASRAFVELSRRYSGTREEIVGRALYGQLLLDQLDEPRRALGMFERYLAAEPSGALAEEARLGRAQALRRLGRARDERAAWLELLREHPGSVHAAAAQTRLATLDSP